MKPLPKPKEKEKRQILANLEYECTTRGIDDERLRVVLMCSPATLRSRRKNPGEFSIDELLRIQNKLKIPISRIIEGV